jgi:hypothetical protein
MATADIPGTGDGTHAAALFEPLELRTPALKNRVVRSILGGGNHPFRDLLEDAAEVDGAAADAHAARP